MRKNILGLVTMLMLVSLVLPATARQKKPLMVAIVYIGPPGDLGWTYEHERADLPCRNYFGDKSTQICRECAGRS
jgi:simple sugar transport system substrate-binding protein